jgi:hypothetical protein
MNKPAIPAADFAQLKTIARKIRDGHEATQIFAKIASDKSQDAFREAVLTGHALASVKQLLGSKFERWMSEHCKALDASTTHFYLSLPGSQNVNIGKAYRKLGIVPQGSS